MPQKAHKPFTDSPDYRKLSEVREEQVEYLLNLLEAWEADPPHQLQWHRLKLMEIQALNPVKRAI